jgi:hypothetical protein
VKAIPQQLVEVYLFAAGDGMEGFALRLRGGPRIAGPLVVVRSGSAAVAVAVAVAVGVLRGGVAAVQLFRQRDTDQTEELADFVLQLGRLGDRLP